MHLYVLEGCRLNFSKIHTTVLTVFASRCLKKLHKQPQPLTLTQAESSLYMDVWPNFILDLWRCNLKQHSSGVGMQVNPLAPAESMSCLDADTGGLAADVRPPSMKTSSQCR